jgi:MFS family permease
MSKRAVAVVIAGFLTVFITFGIRYGYGMLLPEMLPAFQMSKSEAGIIYSGYFIAYTVVSPVLGLMADKFDVRKILAIFIAIMGLGSFLMAFSSSIITASLFFTLTGIGTAACWAPVVALVQRWAGDKRRGTVMTMVDLGSATGIAVWSAVLPLIVASADWKAGWLSMGIIAMAMGVLNYILIRNSPPQASNQEQKTGILIKEPLKTAYKRFLHDGKFWLIALSYLFVGFSVLVPFTFLPTYGVQGLNLPYDLAARLITIIAVTGVIGKLILGPLSDSTGRVKIMMICCTLMAAGGLGMGLSQDFLSLAIVSIIFGIGYGAVWPVYASVTADYFPKEYSGGIMGLWTFLLGIGSILAPVVSGWTIDVSGTFFWAFILAFITSTLGLLLLIPLLRIPPRTKSAP